MTESAPQIVWREAGKPCPDIDPQEMPEPCAICGEACQIGTPIDNVVPRTESGREYFVKQWSEWVCAGCAFVSKGRAADSFRSFSMVYSASGGLEDHTPTAYEKVRGVDEKLEAGSSYYKRPSRLKPLLEHGGDRFHLATKSDHSQHLKVMCDPPDGRWFAGIAESSHKQVIRYADVNHGSPWRVRFEDTDVACDAETFTSITYHASTLKSDGWSEQDILTGKPSQSKLYRMRDSIELWLEHSQALKEHHDSRALELALFCMTKETTDDIREYTAALRRRGDRRDADGGGGGADPVASCLHSWRGQESNQALDVGTESAQDRCESGDELRADGQRDVRPAPDTGRDLEGSRQQDLFDR